MIIGELGLFSGISVVFLFSPASCLRYCILYSSIIVVTLMEVTLGLLVFRNWRRPWIARDDADDSDSFFLRLLFPF